MQWKRSFAWITVFIFLVLAPHGGICQENVEVVVSKGDSLVRICEEYLEEPDEWPQVAGVNAHIRDPNLIYPGERVIIPARLLRGLPGRGRASFVKGVVEIQHAEGEDWMPVQPEEQLIEGVQVRTGAESALEISFEDGSSFYMGAGTCLKVVKARKNRMNGVIGELFLEGGRIITRIKRATGREPRFRIRTPSATAAVRGTEFRVAHDLQGSTRIEVLLGKVSATGRQRTEMLYMEEGTLIKKGRDPVPARDLLPSPPLMKPEPLYRRMPLELRFGKIDGAVSYRIMVARDSDIKDIIRDVVVKPEETAKIADVDDGAYYVRALAVDRLGLEGLPSPVQEISVRANPLPPFTQSPENGKEYKTVAMEFAWLEVSDAVAYHMQIAKDPEFLHTVEDRELSDTVSFKAKNLEPGIYYFRIRSLASDGYKGVWSDVRKFRLLPPPASPRTEPPKLNRKEITLQWQDFGKGYSYHFQMARDAGFNEVVVDERVSEPKITLKKPKKGGMYYVRVSAINEEAFEGRFAPSQSFKVKRFPWGVVGSVVTIGTVIGILAF